MKMSPNRSALKFAFFLATVILTQSTTGFAQGLTLTASNEAGALVEIASVAPLPEAPSAARIGLRAAPAVAMPMAPVAFVHVTTPGQSETSHPFWDGQNKA